MLTMLFLVLVFSGVAGVAGGLLGGLAAAAGGRERAAGESLAAAVDAELPQLQCAECGFPGCLPYARALAQGEAAITLCAPGGAETVRRIAAILGEIPAPMPKALPRKTAFIRAEECVGCALCLPACPTDAIVGAQRFEHSVLAKDCTGCELCLPVCPTDCIEMRP